MAAHSVSAAKLFKISHSLFTQEDGSPHTFYFESKLPDLEKIIHNGCGELTDCPNEASILLCEEKSDHERIGLGYLPLDFVVDCVKKNTLLDIANYRSQKLGLTSLATDSRVSTNQPSVTSTTKDANSNSDRRLPLRDSVSPNQNGQNLNTSASSSEPGQRKNAGRNCQNRPAAELPPPPAHSEASTPGGPGTTSVPATDGSTTGVDSDEEAFWRPSNVIAVGQASLKGRMKYTDAEDFKIIRHLILHNHYNRTNGNQVWKEMENLKVTGHTHQSMKARFKKKILPEVDTYDIPDIWKQLLTDGDAGGARFKSSRLVRSRRSSSSDEDDLTFESLKAWKVRERQKKDAGKEEKEEEEEEEEERVPRSDRLDQCPEAESLTTSDFDELDRQIMQEIETKQSPGSQMQTRGQLSDKHLASLPSTAAAANQIKDPPSCTTRQPLCSSTPGPSRQWATERPSRAHKTGNDSDDSHNPGSSTALPRLTRFRAIASSPVCKGPGLRGMKTKRSGSPSHQRERNHSDNKLVKSSAPSEDEDDDSSHFSPRQAKKTKSKAGRNHSVKTTALSEDDDSSHSSPQAKKKKSKSGRNQSVKTTAPSEDEGDDSTHSSPLQAKKHTTSKAVRKLLDSGALWATTLPQTKESKSKAGSNQSVKTAADLYEGEDSQQSSPKGKGHKRKLLAQASTGGIDSDRSEESCSGRRSVETKRPKKAGLARASSSTSSADNTAGCVDFETTWRRVKVLGEIYHLTEAEAAQCLLDFDGDFQAALLFLEMKS